MIQLIYQCSCPWICLPLFCIESIMTNTSWNLWSLFKTILRVPGFSLDFVCASLWVCSIFGGHHALWKCATWCKGNSQDPLFLFSATDSTKFQFGIDCCSYEAAARWLRKALSLAPPPLTEAWEPTVVNLAHTLRKLKYDMCDVSIFLPLYACMLKVSYVWSIPLPASVCLYASLCLQCAPDLWLK
jgi:hypothetical protein